MSIVEQETATNPETDRKTALFDKYAETYDADVLFFNGVISAETLKIMDIINRQPKQKNLLMILITLGGSPHVAYQLTRILQQSYTKFTLFVSGQCKSAGTLVALGAHELIFSEIGELGPLDIQVSKKDEPFSQESGLTRLAALHTLQKEAAEYAAGMIRQTLYKNPGTLSISTVAEMVTRLTVGLYQPILKQLDPVHLGEVCRALQISEEYGRRLIETGGNVDPCNLEQLVSSYPSHAFIIDYLEAKRLFKSVRLPNALEKLITLALGDLAILQTPQPVTPYNSKLLYLNSENNGRATLHVQEKAVKTGQLDGFSSENFISIEQNLVE